MTVIKKMPQPKLGGVKNLTISLPFINGNQNGATYALGMTVDIYSGNASGKMAFDANSMKVLPATSDDEPAYELTDSNSDYDMIASEEKREEMINSTVSARGSGWGYSANGNINISHFSSFNDNSIIITQSAYQFYRYKKINTVEQKLSAAAAKILGDKNDGPAKFREAYGTHFVGEVHLGKAISAQWVLTCASTASRNNLAASLKVSIEAGTAEGNISASIESAEEDTVTKSHGHGHLTGGGGYKPGDTAVSVISKPEQIADANKLYGEAPPGIMRVVLYPWSDIDGVESALDGWDFEFDSNVHDLAEETSALDQLCVGMSQCLEDKMYAGSIQMTGVQSLLDAAMKQRDDLTTVLQNAMEKGELITKQILDTALAADASSSKIKKEWSDKVMSTFRIRYQVAYTNSWPTLLLGTKTSEWEDSWRHREAVADISWEKANMTPEEKTNGYFDLLLATYTTRDGKHHHFGIRIYPMEMEVVARMHTTDGPYLKVAGLTGSPHDNFASPGKNSSCKSSYGGVLLTVE